MFHMLHRNKRMGHPLQVTMHVKSLWLSENEEMRPFIDFDRDSLVHLHMADRVDYVDGCSRSNPFSGVYSGINPDSRLAGLRRLSDLHRKRINSCKHHTANTT